MGIEKQENGKYDHSDLSKGDAVITLEGHALRSGASLYHYAVVVQVDPVILISEEGDMKWSATVDEIPLKVVGRASTLAMNKAKARLWRDQEQEKREAAEKLLEGLPIVFRVVWTESEAGMGKRPDGVSYSLDRAKLEAERDRISACGSPSEYTTGSDVTRAIVTSEFFAEVKAKGIVSTLRNEHDGVLGLFQPIR